MTRFTPALLVLTIAATVAACEGADLDTASSSSTQGLGDAAAPPPPPPPPPGPPGVAPCTPPLTDDARAADDAARAAFHAERHGLRGHRPPADGAHPMRHRHGGPLLAIYDDDADGTLSDDERAARDADLAAGCTARNAEVVAAFDVDGDALLNATEWAAARDAHHAEHRARIDRRNAATHDVDVDDGGDVDVVATWDADGDGVLSITERRALNNALRSLVREGLRLPRSALRPITTKMATVDASETVVEERP